MAGLEPLPAGGWDSLRSLDMDEWLWLDMEAPGLHSGNVLPESPPSQVSHVWGWSKEALVRARADRDIPSQVVGAVLHLGSETTGERVEVRVTRARRWGPTEGRVRVAYPPGLQDPARGVSLFRVTRSAVLHGGEVSMMPLEFLRLEDQ